LVVPNQRQDKENIFVGSDLAVNSCVYQARIEHFSLKEFSYQKIDESETIFYGFLVEATKNHALNN